MSCPETRQPAEGVRSWSSPPACAVVRISQAAARQYVHGQDPGGLVPTVDDETPNAAVSELGFIGPRATWN
ncbi:hypothetical protein ACFUNF_18615 [Streptomyces sp. NPDC057291]|uniref:hypothetical protein n=1 Tax=Streptomyces sp. NPDC057291 TaxID=3346087 RepID=UPI00363F4714